MYKVLVANRGEIAIRIIRCAGELGWATVTLYTEGDESHATFADEIVKLESVADYLNVELLVNIAERTQCTHLHPGYGFLSENPALARSLPDAVVFIGPSTETLRIASDKLTARELAASLGVKVAPGRRVFSSADILSFANAEGFPVIIKALDGGGGRGIRIVDSEEDVEDAFNRCQGESPSHQLFIEKAHVGAGWKHVEVQIIGDGTGAVSHLWERECSVQRRFQKIIEFAPCRLPRAGLEPLLQASMEMAKTLLYRGLGTFEFLVNSQTLDWIFLEINPRIQVEHTITEEITGIDLVHSQLLLSTPATSLVSLSLDSPPPRPHEFAIQLRLSAEDPSRSFKPSVGTVRSTDILWPSGPGTRVDTWLCMGPSVGQTLSSWAIGSDFDSLLAKIIVRGRSFKEASRRATRVVRELKFEGSVATNRSVLAGAVNHPDWLAGRVDILWLERNIDEVLELGKQVLRPPPSAQAFHADRARTSAPSHGTLLQPETVFHLTLSPLDDPSSSSTKHTLMLSSISQNSFPEALSGVLQTSFSTAPLNFSLSQSASASVGSSAFELANPNDASHIASPLTGKIVDLHPVLLSAKESSPSGLIKSGETIAVLSVMKMESTITAPYDAHVSRLGKDIHVGAIVGEGMLICVLNSSLSSKL